MLPLYMIESLSSNYSAVLSTCNVLNERKLRANIRCQNIISTFEAHVCKTACTCNTYDTYYAAAASHCTLLHLYCTLPGTVLYCCTINTTLYCTVLYCTVFHYGSYNTVAYFEHCTALLAVGYYGNDCWFFSAHCM